MFETVLGISSYIGLAAFFLACFFTYLRSRLETISRNAAQFNDDELKLNYLQNKGYIPSKRSKLSSKNALSELNARLNHQRKMLFLVMVVLLFIAITFLFGFAISKIGCDVEISNTGQNSVSIGCNYD